MPVPILGTEELLEPGVGMVVVDGDSDRDDDVTAEEVEAVCEVDVVVVNVIEEDAATTDAEDPLLLLLMLLLLLPVLFPLADVVAGSYSKTPITSHRFSS